jgi:hypothetical protein
MLREANDDRLKAVIFGFGQGEGIQAKTPVVKGANQSPAGASLFVSPNFSAISSTKFVT